MSQRWWVRMFRPRSAERHTDAMLGDIRRALRKLDMALAAVESVKRKRGPDGR